MGISLTPSSGSFGIPTFSSVFSASTGSSGPKNYSFPVTTSGMTVDFAEVNLRSIKDSEICEK
jgi:hypothetical protein